MSANASDMIQTVKQAGQVVDAISGAMLGQMGAAAEQVTMAGEVVRMTRKNEALLALMEKVEEQKAGLETNRRWWVEDDRSSWAENRMAWELDVLQALLDLLRPSAPPLAWPRPPTSPCPLTGLELLHQPRQREAEPVRQFLDDVQ